MCSSRSCFGATPEGAPIMRSSAQSSMTMRSIPGAMPPCGGAPSDKARSMPPNLASSTSSGYPAIANAFFMTSGRWFRIEPQERVGLHIRHRERVVREVDLLFFFVPLVHREVDDPGEFEAILVDQL